MTPPVMINSSDDEEEEDYDYVDEDRGHDGEDRGHDDEDRGHVDQLTASMKDDVYDSEDDDMDALVNEAEKLLLSSGSLDLSERALNEDVMKTPGVSYKTAEYALSDENNEVSEYETEGTEELQEGLKALLKGSARNQTFTIDTIQRKLEVEVPEVLTPHWLDSLPLIVVAEEVRGRVPALISKLQHALDQKNHQEEYKVSENQGKVYIQ